jgi:DNA-binding MarR family transcriptional regulator
MEEWRIALEQAMAPKPGEPGWKTSREIIEQTGISESRLLKFLRVMSRDGHVEIRRELRPTFIGTMCVTPVYRIKQENRT